MSVFVIDFLHRLVTNLSQRLVGHRLYSIKVGAPEIVAHKELDTKLVGSREHYLEWIVTPHNELGCQLCVIKSLAMCGNVHQDQIFHACLADFANLLTPLCCSKLTQVTVPIYTFFSSRMLELKPRTRDWLYLRIFVSSLQYLCLCKVRHNQTSCAES